MTATRPTSTHSLGAKLERDRLERRVSRMTVAVGLLRQRTSERRRDPDGPPRHLRRVLTDFETQIEAMNARLRDLGSEPPSTPDPAMERSR
jgi:hypothetical protein